MAKLKTTAAAQNEVAKAFVQLAQLMRVYADDQHGSMRWQSTARARRECEVRAEVYNSIADEILAIEIETN